MNPLYIENAGTIVDKVDALINVVNILTEKMFETTVKQATKDIANLNTATDKLLSNMDISISCLLQNGLVDAEDVKKIFTEWLVDYDYKAGDIVVYGDAVYECLQEHHSLANWTPDAAHSLWKKLYTVAVVADEN